MLTYAILEAMNRPDEGRDEPIDLLGLARHVSLRVIEISKTEFGVIQMAKTDVKDNFTLGMRRPVLKSITAACEMPERTGAPNHIVARDAQARTKPSDDAAISMLLARNTLVTVQACVGPWALIARGGRDVGFIRYNALEKTVN